MRIRRYGLFILLSVLAVVGVTIGTSYIFDVKAKVAYEDIEKFPESYKDALYALKEKHPNWTFEVMNTGLDWNTVIYNEMNPANRSLVPSYFDSSFVGAYYGDGWSCATQAAVEYYLDPRNWLTEDYIFQFEKLTYNGSTQGIATVQKVLTGTFMSGFIQSDAYNNYTQIGLTYAQAFSDIGRSIGVSPVHLATRVKQEQGAQGTSDLISGTYPGYEGYYNYYNIQATGKEHDEIVRNGLNEAKSEGWNTRYAALLGGSKKVSERYILRGQDTLYLQKFDVDGSYDGRYWHQYMQNLAAPSNEGRNIKKAYASAGMLDEAFVFKIPVYNNMPYQDGFVLIEGKKYYYNNGVPVKGSYEIDNSMYYFDLETGVMYKNQVATIDDKHYFYGEDGKRVIGKIQYYNAYWYLCEKITGEISKSEYAGNIFSAEDYARYNPDVMEAYDGDEKKMLEHWLCQGIYEGRRPSELYSYEYYSRSYNGKTVEYGDDKESVVGHFVLVGMDFGYSGSEEFNVIAYMTCNKDLYEAFAGNMKLYYQHYMNSGRSENRPHGTENNIYEKYTLGKIFFDPTMYAQKNSDLVNVYGEDANKLFLHWIKYGIYEGRCASRVYDRGYYLSNHGDLGEIYKEDSVGAMLHFFINGIPVFETGSAEFNPLGYAMRYTDLVNAFGENALWYYIHYCSYGFYENRLSYNQDDIALIFDVNYYKDANPDVYAMYKDENDLKKHFALYGIREGRIANPNFDVHKYKDNYGDLREAYGDNIYQYFMHYILYGYAEGRSGK